MLRLAVFAILLMSASARAETEEPPPLPVPASPGERVDRGFLGAGVLVGGDTFLHGALTLEGGIKVPDVPLWLHAIGATGDAFDFEGGGAYLRGLGGIETRSCSSPYACLLVDVDVGYQTSTWSNVDMDPVEHHEGAVVAGRIGVDAGGDRVRFRAALEVVRTHDHSNVTPAAWGTGGGLSLGLVYRL